jgi:hypothetical protein
LALAASLADLRVGTWVYASPLRPAWTTAWEAHSLSVLTDGPSPDADSSDMRTSLRRARHTPTPPAFDRNTVRRFRDRSPDPDLGSESGAIIESDPDPDRDGRR